LENSTLKRYILVPILSILTAFFLLLFIHWYPKLKKSLLYNKSYLGRATHLFIVGTTGNMEIVEIINRNAEFVENLDLSDSILFQDNPLITFDYRFIRFEYDHNRATFLPVKFNINLPFSEILSKFSDGIGSE